MQEKDNESKTHHQNDVTFEPSEESENLKDPSDAIRSLKEKLKTCQKERQEYLDGWQRAKADYITPHLNIRC